MKNIKKIYTFSSVLILSLLLTSCHFDNKETTVVEEKKMEEKMVKHSDSMIEEKVMLDTVVEDEKTEVVEVEKSEEFEVKEVEDIEEVEENVESTSSYGVYTNYSEENLKNYTGNIVLYFHADWCPACKTANKNFLGEKTPENLNLLKVNYDDSTELKKKYGVTYQHTFVQVDSEGNMINKWGSSKNYDSIISKIK